MPLYTCECESCSSHSEYYSPIASRRDSPNCECGGDTHIIITPTQIAPAFQSYKAIAGDGRWIHSRTQHKNFLRENNLTEVGNDKSILPEE